MNPVAVAAAERETLAAGDAEDRLVLVGPGTVEHLDEHEVAGLTAALLAVDAAGGILERGAVPAAVLCGGGDEVAIDLLELGLERGP